MGKGAWSKLKIASIQLIQMSLDPKRVLGVVMSHAKAKENTQRHIPYWFKVCDHILLYTPENQKLKLNDPRIEELEAFGDPREHAGIAISLRTHSALKEALTRKEYDYIILFEYDSLCWGPIPDSAVPPEGSMGCSMFENEPYDVIAGIKFLSPIYLHFPHLYTRTAVEKMLAAADDGRVRWDAEHGFVDRWLGMLAHVAGVPVLDYRAMNLGYSWENISYSGPFPKRVEECVTAVKNGAVFSHGVKDAETLKRISQFGAFGQL